MAFVYPRTHPQYNGFFNKNNKNNKMMTLRGSRVTTEV
jgi:hypothetical protein